jgi:hypothetical protein
MTTKQPQVGKEAFRQQTEERAHRLWEEEGRPHGRDLAHWSQAEAEIEASQRKVTPKQARKRSPRAGIRKVPPKQSEQ